jgi:hypothetical protein
LPGQGILAAYLLGCGVLVVLAHWGVDRMGHLPRPPAMVLWIAPGIAALVWMVQTLADPNPLRVVLPVALGLIWGVMRRLGEPGARVSLGGSVPLWQHGLVLIAPAVAVGLAPVGWAQGWGTLGANWVVAGATCLLSLIWLGWLIWRSGFLRRR